MHLKPQTTLSCTNISPVTRLDEVFRAMRVLFWGEIFAQHISLRDFKTRSARNFTDGVKIYTCAEMYAYVNVNILISGSDDFTKPWPINFLVGIMTDNNWQFLFASIKRICLTVLTGLK